MSMAKNVKSGRGKVGQNMVEHGKGQGGQKMTGKVKASWVKNGNMW